MAKRKDKTKKVDGFFAIEGGSARLIEAGETFQEGGVDPSFGFFNAEKGTGFQSIDADVEAAAARARRHANGSPLQYGTAVGKTEKGATVYRIDGCSDKGDSEEQEAVANHMADIINTPLAISPEKLPIIMQAIEAAASGGDMSAFLSFFVEDDEDRKPYQIVNGTAIIPIMGALTKRSNGFFSMLFGRQAYSRIQDNFKAALADDKAERVLLQLDTPGGTVQGMLELSDTIFEARGDKPIIAQVDENALSAGYGIASAADTIITTKMGSLGSIGTIMVHVDRSEMIKRAGIKVTSIASGKFKDMFSPYKPLSKEALGALQTEVEEVNEMFIGTVARNRDMDSKDLRNLEAASFRGDKAIEAGLADKIGTFGDTVKAETTILMPEEGKRMGKDPKSEGKTEGEQDTAEAREEGRKAAQAETKEIVTLCAIAGVPDKATEYLAEGLNPSQVREKLMELKKDPNANKIDAKPGEGSEPEQTYNGPVDQHPLVNMCRDMGKQMREQKEAR